MDIWHITAFVLGFSAGYLNRFSIEMIRGILFGPPRAKPLRLVPMRTYAYTAPASIEPMDHSAQWRVWTHRFITFSEMVSRERGKRIDRLPSYRDYAAALGDRRFDRHLRPYIQLLAAHGVIVVSERGGAWWAMGKAGRRAALPYLPYPRDARPPRWPFYAARHGSVADCDSVAA